MEAQPAPTLHCDYGSDFAPNNCIGLYTRSGATVTMKFDTMYGFETWVGTIDKSTMIVDTNGNGETVFTKR